jgi:uncharacterized RDD family membrane protein YckC
MPPETITVREETYQVAPWSLRIGAKAIDSALCQGALGFAVPVVYTLLPEVAASVTTLVLAVLAVWWWLASDGVLHGAGLGKGMLGLRLVHRRHGSAPTQGQAALRQLKYSMFLSGWGLLWGLTALSHDDSHNRDQADEFVTVRTRKQQVPSPETEAAAVAAPPPRPINVEALGSFLSDKYSHKDHSP